MIYVGICFSGWGQTAHIFHATGYARHFRVQVVHQFLPESLQDRHVPLLLTDEATGCRELEEWVGQPPVAPGVRLCVQHCL